MEIKEFIDSWLEATNSFDTKHYLDFFLTEAILDDPSVGEKFTGHSGIKYYFESYFIGYNTQTVLNELIVNKDNSAYLEVEFTGDFPERVIKGSFDLLFKNNKIAYVKADLIH